MTCLPSKCDSVSIYEKLPGLGSSGWARAEASEGEACYKSVRPCQNVIKINITWEQERGRKGED